MFQTASPSNFRIFKVKEGDSRLSLRFAHFWPLCLAIHMKNLFLENISHPTCSFFLSYVYYNGFDDLMMFDLWVFFFKFLRQGFGFIVCEELHQVQQTTHQDVGPTVEMMLQEFSCQNGLKFFLWEFLGGWKMIQNSFVEIVDSYFRCMDVKTSTIINGCFIFYWCFVTASRLTSRMFAPTMWGT